jgi:hypothetical protein
MRSVVILLALIMSIGLLGTAQTYTTVGTGIYGVGNNNLWDFAEYNGELYATGNFLIAGGLTARHIAKWNGFNWAAVGTGTPYPHTAKTLAVFNNELYMAGDFDSAGSVAVNKIAKWNGTSWSSVGNGIKGSFVNDLIVYNGELYAGGQFDTAGNVYAHNIAKWNGTSWSPVAGGTNNGVFGFGIYNNELLVGGNFTLAGSINTRSFAKWNGSAWSTFGTGFSKLSATAEVYCFKTVNNEVYIGGAFDSANGISAHNIVKWNGTQFSALGNGIILSPTFSPYNAWVVGMEVFNNELYVTGLFSSAGTINANNIAKWNGSTWSNIGNGLSTGTVSVPNYGLSLANYSSELYVGGKFSTAGTVAVNNIAKLTNCITPISAPSPIVGNSTVCSGTSQIYSVPSGPGAISYNWILPPGWSGSSNIATINVTPGLSGGNISVSAVNNCGNSFPQSMAVNVNPSPVAMITTTAPLTFCQGGAVLLNAGNMAGQTYQWLRNGNFLPGATDTSYLAVTSGYYSVVVSNGSCSSNSLVDTVTVHPLPIPLIIQNANTLIAPTGFINYEWFMNGVIISGANSNTYIYTTSGNYHVIVTDGNGCIGQSNNLLINEVNEIANRKNVAIYPNPTSGELKITLFQKSNDNVIEFCIYEVTGKIVHNGKLNKVGRAFQANCNLSRMKDGCYFVRISGFDEKFIIIKN